MKRIAVSILSLGMVLASIAGCGETSSSKTETTIKTPGGETTITTQKDIKQTGENPPAARP